MIPGITTRDKISPLLWRGAGVGCPEPERPTPEG